MSENTNLLEPNLATPPDLRAPMASAPLCYGEDGSVEWDQMWDTFCVLSSEGGPPHRDEMLTAPLSVDPTTDEYQQVAEELIRGIRLVSGLEASLSTPGWLAVRCDYAPQAHWISEQIEQENVQSYAKEEYFFVPIDSTYTISQEIKNVITVVAKTTHYWQDHIGHEIKNVMVWEAKIRRIWQGWRGMRGKE